MGGWFSSTRQDQPPAETGDSRTWVIFVGLDGVGKTSLVYRLKTGEADMLVQSSFGGNIEQLEYSGFPITAWDTGGRVIRLGDLTSRQGSNRVLARKFSYPLAEAAIYMIDSAARERMQEAKDDFHGMLSSLHEDVPVLVLANKQDVKGAMTVDEISKVLDLDALRQNSPATKFAILGCAVHNGENLTEAMQWICAVLREGRASGRFPKPRTDPA